MPCKARLLAACLCLAACGGSDEPDDPRTVGPCVERIGRPDLIADPEAPMSNSEIEALLDCVAGR